MFNFFPHPGLCGSPKEWTRPMLALLPIVMARHALLGGRSSGADISVRDVQPPRASQEAEEGRSTGDRARQVAPVHIIVTVKVHGPESAGLWQEACRRSAVCQSG